MSKIDSSIQTVVLLGEPLLVKKSVAEWMDKHGSQMVQMKRV